MRPDEIEEIRAIPLFSGVEPANFSDIITASYLQKFPAHVDLVREGDPADFLHVVLEGQVEAYSLYNGRESTVDVLGPGQSFIVAAVVLDRVYLKSARALSDCRVLMCAAGAVRKYFQNDAALARNLAMEMAYAYRNIVKELKNQKLRTTQQRLANWLIHQNEMSGNRNEFDIPFDKKILASKLGMVPEVLSRIFSAMADHKVSVKGTRVKLGDPGSLKRFARPLPTFDDPEV